ncbi:universal stress protein [Bordetella holmesii]|uniref:Universal stress family protein n=2 Tax=Bordetella holmesii TaxID=35814 RepID=A0A158M5Y3_9BORD|nr:universal stress protein [Bordetella holmesii]AHV94787.1 universal stress family protein [Bordetella holmesii ATCC 51541]AIT27503.1 universal stress family protein [Bordetella holmesii 44057]EWM44237.1 universal stress family protein [Bordetella holmesii 41130]EWM48094.1 universal stress family protein [Bordetella holmesii 35009]EWM49077.1 universal stress family protein [Bordetella holmesii 70147]
MKPVVVPVDGSDHALRALAAALDSRLYPHLGEVHLVTVQPPLLRQGLHLGLRQEDIDAYQAEESATALKAARDMLDKAGMPYSVHNEIGAVAECIVNVAQGCQASEIVMGTRGLGSIASVLLGSVATKVVRLADRPVTLVQ